MATAERDSSTWFSATCDLLLAVLGFALVWYPFVSLGNAVLGTPVADTTVTAVVGVLALGGAYPVLAGDWSLGRLGEFVFALTASAFAWGILGMLCVLAFDLTIAGSDRRPQAAVWAVAYATAYLLVYRIDLSRHR